MASPQKNRKTVETEEKNRYAAEELVDFLDQLALVQDQDGLDADEAAAARVKLMTIHAAKGLERAPASISRGAVATPPRGGRATPPRGGRDAAAGRRAIKAGRRRRGEQPQKMTVREERSDETPEGSQVRPRRRGRLRGGSAAALLRDGGQGGRCARGGRRRGAAPALRRPSARSPTAGSVRARTSPTC